jgi:hypothetical protein
MILMQIASCLIYFTAMIMAFIWKPRPGKILFCIWLLLTFIISLMGVAINFIINTEIGREFRPYIQIYSYFSGTIHLISVILLLSFIIISREYYVPADNYDYENKS